MNNIQHKRLGDLLVDSGKISDEQLVEMLKKQKQTNKRLGELLIEDHLVSEEDIIDILQIQLGMERVYLDMQNIDKNAVFSIPERLASKYALIPIEIKDNKIKVVMSDPLNIFAVDDVRIASGYEVEPVIASKAEIIKYIDGFYSQQFAQKAAEELSKERKQEQFVKDTKEDSLNDIKNAPAVKLIDSIIKQAVKEKASDVHIEPFEKFVKVRNRIDGKLQETMRLNKDTHGALITRIKILANLDIAEKRLPQDGRIITKVDDMEIDLRVSTIPTVHGEKVVVRLLRRDSFMVSRKSMGLQPDDIAMIDRIIQNPYGIILVTGPTGSGKSTTLYSVLNDMNTPDKNIITVEDPVEYMMEGINQVNVNSKIGMTFAAGLRSILRQDPDIIMIGEIRDSETAEIAIRSAITGHIILSTMHTNDAPSTAVRLVDMGVEPYLVASSLVGVISQRLVRKICSYCKEDYDASSQEKKMFNKEDTEVLKLYKGRGCPYCSNTGYSGRIGVYEIMEISREHRELLMANKSADEIRDISIKNGMKTLKAACSEMVLNGITTIDELIRIAYLKE